VVLDGDAPPLTLLLGWWWGWKRPRRLAKGSGGHRLGGRNFHSLAWHSTEAVREAEVRAAGSRPAGRRLPVGGTRVVAAPGAGCEAGVWAEGTALWQAKPLFGRRRWARSERRVAAAAWVKSKPGMKAAPPWVGVAASPPV